MIKFILYVNALIVVFLFITPSCIIDRWYEGIKPNNYMTCLASLFGYPHGYDYTFDELWDDIKKGWYQFK